MNTPNFENMTLEEIAVALKLDEEKRALMESIENDEWVIDTPRTEVRGFLSSPNTDS